MPLVNVHMAEGRTVEEKSALMSAITDAVVQNLGAPRETVRVWITEMCNTDYMVGGELLADKQARLASRSSRTAADTDEASGNGETRG